MPDDLDEGQGQGQGQGQQYLRRGADLRPVPDPTVLTSAALAREVAALKELVFTRLDALDRSISLANENSARVPTQLDRAIAGLQALNQEKFDSIQQQFDSVAALRNDKFATIQQQFDERDARLAQAAQTSAVESALKANQAILDERFSSIQTQFAERDTRVETTARDTRVAVDAALQAAEKAVGKQNESFALSIAKSEAATAKSIDQQGAIIQTATTSLKDQIDDMKERLTRLEGQQLGRVETRAEAHTSSSLIVAIVSTVIAFVAILIAASVAVSHGLPVAVGH